MTKGLVLARAFHEAGHNVIGADFETYGLPVSGRFSRALRKFYALPKPNEKDGSASYIHHLLQIVRREKVHLWVSCSGVASAVEDGQAKEVLERRSDCIAIQFDVDTTSTLHEKHTFIQRARRLGLPVPETHNVTSRSAVHKVLNASPPSTPSRKRKQYIMKSVGVDDASRGNMTLLPRRTISETYQHVSNIPISGSNPWVLQQYIQGKEYCTHALIVNGQVKAFVACPSSELLMHYEALPAISPLSRSMLRFTQAFVARSGGSMTGHLSFDFLVDESVTEKGLEMVLQPIECNPRAHTAVVLFNGLGSEMASAYLSALDSPRYINGSAHSHPNSGAEPDDILAPANAEKYYWLGHDIVSLIFSPFLVLLQRKTSLKSYTHGICELLNRVLFWKDSTYEVWDPLPWWWLYQIYWPGVFLACLITGTKWSRVNVSTTKVFRC